jgi:hypothetical protein
MTTPLFVTNERWKTIHFNLGFDGVKKAQWIKVDKKLKEKNIKPKSDYIKTLKVLPF